MFPDKAAVQSVDGIDGAVPAAEDHGRIGKDRPRDQIGSGVLVKGPGAFHPPVDGPGEGVQAEKFIAQRNQINQGVPADDIGRSTPFDRGSPDGRTGAHIERVDTAGLVSPVAIGSDDDERIHRKGNAVEAEFPAPGDIAGPADISGPAVETEEATVAGADKEQITDDRRRGADSPAGFDRPDDRPAIRLGRADRRTKQGRDQA